MVAGGIIPPGANYTDVVELYDGSSWTEDSRNKYCKIFYGGSGTTNTAVVVAGGESPIKAKQNFGMVQAGQK